MTHNPKRAPYTAQTKAKVRKLREEGYSNVQITEATGVPASTIARWAAEGGWRVKDLVEEPAFNAPETPPLGLLPGLGGEGWHTEDRSFLRRQESGPAAETRDPRLRGDERDEHTNVRPDVAQRDRACEEQARAQQKARQARLEEALTNTARAAEDAIMRGNFAAAAKATQMADTLSRSLERVRVPEEEEQPDGVFYSHEQIAAARAELMRRLDRIAATIRPDEMVEG